MIMGEAVHEGQPNIVGNNDVYRYLTNPNQQAKSCVFCEAFFSDLILMPMLTTCSTSPSSSTSHSAFLQVAQRRLVQSYKREKTPI